MIEDAERNDEPQEAGTRGQARRRWTPASLSRMSIFVVLLVLNAAVSFFLVDRVVRPKADEARAQTETRAAEPGELFFVNEVIVNPAGTRASRHLRVSAAIEYDGERKLGDEAGRRLPQLRDVFISEFSRRTIDELVDERVREEIREVLLAQVNRTLTSGQFTNLYFTEYVIQ